MVVQTASRHFAGYATWLKILASNRLNDSLVFLLGYPIVYCYFDCMYSAAALMLNAASIAGSHLYLCQVGVVLAMNAV